MLYRHGVTLKWEIPAISLSQALWELPVVTVRENNRRSFASTERNNKMRHCKVLICLIVFGLATLGAIATAQEDRNHGSDVTAIKIMSYNLKFASPTFKPSWEVRREMQVDMIRQYSPDIIGTQESLKEQIDYLMDH
jgi:hypothetical protein